MVEYTYEELANVVEWQQDQLNNQASTIKHLQEVIELYINEEIQGEQSANRFVKEHLNDGYINDGMGWNNGQDS